MLLQLSISSSFKMVYLLIASYYKNQISEDYSGFISLALTTRDVMFLGLT